MSSNLNVYRKILKTGLRNLIVVNTKNIGIRPAHLTKCPNFTETLEH